MTSIRIAIAAALLVAIGFAGGMTHATRGQAHAPARAAALASAPTHNSPVLCCGPG